MWCNAGVSDPSGLSDALRAALAAEANPERAAGQQRYMKSALPFHGVPVPRVRAIVRTMAAAHPLPDRASWLAAVRAIWDDATHREQRYGAIGLLRHRRYRAWLTPDEESIELLRHLVTSGAWWDLVDELAAHVAGEFLRADPPTMVPVLRGWAGEPDLWLRRTAILSQLGARDATDTDLLVRAIEGSIDDPGFFARKAIGWALREYSKTDEAWVRGYVAANAGRLSALSRREALTWLSARPAG